MNQAISIPQSAYKQLLNRISHLEQLLQQVLSRLDQEPPYGSDEWWAWSEKQATEDIKAGRTTTIRNKQELKEFFKSLK